MKKIFKVAHIRKFEREVSEGKITSSRMVEIMNEMAFEAYVNTFPNDDEIWELANKRVEDWNPCGRDEEYEKAAIIDGFYDGAMYIINKLNQ